MLRRPSNQCALKWDSVMESPEAAKHKQRLSVLRSAVKPINMSSSTQPPITFKPVIASTQAQATASDLWACLSAAEQFHHDSLCWKASCWLCGSWALS